MNVKDIKNIKKIFIISDLHFGIHHDSQEWMEIINNYFNDWLIPLLKEKSDKNSALFILGDVFDSRRNMNIIVYNKLHDILEKLSDILPIHVIIGNHDMGRTDTTRVNSLKFLHNWNNIKLYEEPQVIEVANGKKCFMLPWQISESDIVSEINANNADYLFAHMSIKSFYYNRKLPITNGVEYKDIKKYKYVFSGHIHFTQNKDNIYYVGSPYQLTRNDIGSKKYVHVLDVESESIELIENDFSPKFLKIKLSNILDMEVSALKDIVANNFVDIINDLPSNILINFDKLLSMIEGYAKINLIIDTNNVATEIKTAIAKKEFDINTDSIYEDTEDDINLTDEMVQFDILSIAKKSIENINYDKSIKDAVFLKIIELYKTVNEDTFDFIK